VVRTGPVDGHREPGRQVVGAQGDLEHPGRQVDVEVGGDVVRHVPGGADRERVAVVRDDLGVFERPEGVDEPARQRYRPGPGQARGLSATEQVVGGEPRDQRLLEELVVVLEVVVDLAVAVEVEPGQHEERGLGVGLGEVRELVGDVGREHDPGFVGEQVGAVGRTGVEAVGQPDRLVRVVAAVRRRPPLVAGHLGVGHRAVLARRPGAARLAGRGRVHADLVHAIRPGVLHGRRGLLERLIGIDVAAPGPGDDDRRGDGGDEHDPHGDHQRSLPGPRRGRGGNERRRRRRRRGRRGRRGRRRWRRCGRHCLGAVGGGLRRRLVRLLIVLLGHGARSRSPAAAEGSPGQVGGAVRATRP
jgi:hypothetical protein